MCFWEKCTKEKLIISSIIRDGLVHVSFVYFVQTRLQIRLTLQDDILPFFKLWIMSQSMNTQLTIIYALQLWKHYAKYVTV